ncbi:CPBP family glutamic-type intramembrane protease [Oricola thermophila]|uniref:CPBP family intramembrane metalloprotease n=1 Tax=Oricola thermophila TaxID=2742145 RepID=A0A6N1VGU9_9HYPH|nr:CPBP family glutamic-type intramembrane protease [Oricola thermophila]QKV20146.1 CPBP family intramembrane metalloprotease [Oricola thermophila]
MTIRALPIFFLLAFGIAWGTFALLVAMPETLAGLFGPVSASNPLFFLAVWAPAIGAVALVLAAAGPGGLVRYLSRLLLWRAPLAWYLFVLAGIPAIYYAGAAIKGEPFDIFPFDTAGDFLAASAFMLILGPMEELGWRGLALPLMQRLAAPFWAGLALGIVWAVWHLPAFLLSGTPQSNWEFLPFLAGSVSVSVIVTPLFNASRGSILLPLLLHFQLNGPAWPDAQPHDNWLFVLAAVIVVWLNRGTMFTRSDAVTDAIPLAPTT